MHPFDWALCRRSLGAIGASVGVAAVVIVATDEPGSTAPMRVARLAAICPVIVATSLLAVVALSSARGELGALHALGASPWRAARGASIAGSVTAAISVALLLSPWADVASLFPAIHLAPLDWQMDANRHLAHAAGVVVFADGAIALAGAATSRADAALAPWAALPCLAPIAVVVPAWAVTPLSVAARAVSVLVTAALAITALHLVAAGQTSPVAGLVAVVPLGVATALGRVRS